MSKNNIIKKLQRLKWIDNHWRVKDFIIYEDSNIIKFSYNHGDMGIVDKIIYYKENNFTKVFELNNYYGDTEEVVSLYL